MTTDDTGTPTTPLMTSHDLGIDLDHLRDLVRRKMCKPTVAGTSTTGYLWSPEDAAEALRARDFDNIRREFMAKLGRQDKRRREQLDKYKENLKQSVAAEAHLWGKDEDVQPAPTPSYTTGVENC